MVLPNATQSAIIWSAFSQLFLLPDGKTHTIVQSSGLEKEESGVTSRENDNKSNGNSHKIVCGQFPSNGRWIIVVGRMFVEICGQDQSFKVGVQSRKNLVVLRS